jgi:3-oxoacyl-[acyl-carrier protein] reductase
MNFEGKNILVVGGSSGIGLALVKLLHQQNAGVFVVSRSASEEWPEDVHFLKADVTENLDAVETFLPQQLHGLVYSVGSITLKPFNRLTAEDFLKDFQLNVLGAARMIQQAIRPVKNAAGSSIVLISSVAARTGRC